MRLKEIIRKKSIIFLLLFSTLFASGCAMTKQEIGTGIGGVVGAVLGSKVGKGSGRTAAIALGGLIGGWIGSSIGAHLDEKDRQSLMTKSGRILNQNGGQTGTWKSGHSGASATIRTSQTQKKSKRVKIVKHRKVDTSPKLSMIGRIYVTTNSSNIRHRPSTSGQIISGLRRGERFTAVGKTNSNWILVSKNNITLGYIHAPLAKPYKKKTKATPVRDKAISLDDISDKDIAVTNKTKKDGVNLDKIDLEEVSVSATTDCKKIDMDVKTNKGSNKDSFEACKGSDGAWEII